MRMKRRLSSAECEHCGGMRAGGAAVPFDAMRQQLESCRNSIEAALKQLQLPDSASTASDCVVDDDIFRYGPQGAD